MSTRNPNPDKTQLDHSRPPSAFVACCFSFSQFRPLPSSNGPQCCCWLPLYHHQATTKLDLCVSHEQAAEEEEDDDEEGEEFFIKSTKSRWTCCPGNFGGHTATFITASLYIYCTLLNSGSSRSVSSCPPPPIHSSIQRLNRGH